MLLEIENAPVIARGSQRLCYQHPTDPSKCIKVNTHPTGTQQRRELDYLQHFQRRHIPFEHMPVFHGTIDTTQGVGLVFEHIRDADGSTSDSLDAYIRRHGMHRVGPALQELKESFFKWNVITCDMSFNNFLVRQLADSSIEIVMIDGLGNREAIPLSSYIATLGRIKMRRRWRRFDRKLETFAASSAAPS